MSLLDLLFNPALGAGMAPVQPVGGQMPMIDPSAGPMPTMAPPAMPVQQPIPGLLGRIQNALLPAPQGLGGLLSPDDQSAARQQGMLALGGALLDAAAPHVKGTGPTLGQALAHGIQAGQQGFQQHLMSALQNRQIATQMQQQQKIQAARDAIAQNAPPANATPEQRANWVLQQMLPMLAAGDYQGVDALGQVAKGIHENAQKPDRFQTVQGGDAIYRFDPQTGALTKLADRGMNPDEKQFRATQLQEAQQRLALQGEQLKQTVGNRAANVFNTQNKDLIAAIPLEETAIAQIDNARASKNPAAMKSALMNYIQAVDAKPQLRMGLLQTMQTIDPSLKGKAEAMFAKWRDGSIPDDQLNMMEQAVRTVAGTHRTMYDTRLKELVSRQPYAAGLVTPTETLFGGGQTAAATSPAPAAGPDLQRAKTDPAYAAWLRSKGVRP